MGVASCPRSAGSLLFMLGPWKSAACPGEDQEWTQMSPSTQGPRPGGRCKVYPSHPARPLGLHGHSIPDSIPRKETRTWLPKVLYLYCHSIRGEVLGKQHPFSHPFEESASRTYSLLHGNHQYFQSSAATLPATSALQTPLSLFMSSPLPAPQPLGLLLDCGPCYIFLIFLLM